MTLYFYTLCVSLWQAGLVRGWLLVWCRASSVGYKNVFAQRSPGWPLGKLQDDRAEELHGPQGLSHGSFLQVGGNKASQSRSEEQMQRWHGTATLFSHSAESHTILTWLVNESDLRYRKRGWQKPLSWFCWCYHKHDEKRTNFFCIYWEFRNLSSALLRTTSRSQGRGKLGSVLPTGLSSPYLHCIWSHISVSVCPKRPWALSGQTTSQIWCLVHEWMNSLY